MACGWGHERDLNIVRYAFSAAGQRDFGAMQEVLSDEVLFGSPVRQVIGATAARGWLQDLEDRGLADMQLLGSVANEGSLILVVGTRSRVPTRVDFLEIRRERITRWQAIPLIQEGERTEEDGPPLF